MKKLNPIFGDPKQNNILASLPSADLQRILPHLNLVEMRVGEIVEEAGEHVMYVYFPISGFLSLVHALADGSSIEVAMVGNEGMLGISIYMGGESMTSSSEVMSAAKAFRLDGSVFLKEFTRGGQLNRTALLYAQTLLVQTSQTAICNKYHTNEQQLCRWLLMSLDRLPDNQVFMTHSKISKLLGVRRESISVMAAKLQSDGVISYSRGLITVNSIAKLKNKSCECHKIVTNECHRLLPMKIKKPIKE